MDHGHYVGHGEADLLWGCTILFQTKNDVSKIFLFMLFLEWPRGRIPPLLEWSRGEIFSLQHKHIKQHFQYYHTISLGLHGSTRMLKT